MKLPRRRFLHLAAGTVALPAVSRIAGAQTYPARPITMIVPFAAGGATDVIARLVAKPMGESLGRSIIMRMSAAPTEVPVLAGQPARGLTAIRSSPD
jgi:tripartite-type tricarboxylate transporter receptor subunit TctC